MNLNMAEEFSKNIARALAAKRDQIIFSAVRDAFGAEGATVKEIMERGKAAELPTSSILFYMDGKLLLTIHPPKLIKDDNDFSHEFEWEISFKRHF